jgi:hypothetical protein
MFAWTMAVFRARSRVLELVWVAIRILAGDEAMFLGHCLANSRMPFGRMRTRIIFGFRSRNRLRGLTVTESRQE